MISKTKVLATALILALTTAGMGCSPDEPKKVDRWATTENTNVKIDWDKVNQAYKDASGPEDLEKRINEIYEGDEIISIAVADETDKTQVVTGFFDKNKSGSVDEGEKIFTIKREPTGEGEAKVQTVGHGAYAGYVSPFWTIASSMMMGAMISSMFMPSYAPMAYTTNQGRIGQLQNQRSNYRAANPQRFGPRSQTGRQYGGKPSSPTRSSGGRSSGGGRFGLARRGRTVRPARLTA
jgi:hypothetical protein